MSIQVMRRGETVDKERAADLIVSLEAAARAHGFLLGIKVELSGPDEVVGLRLRFIQATDATLPPLENAELVRLQAMAELEKPVPYPESVPLLEPYDWGPDGPPQGEPFNLSEVAAEIKADRERMGGEGDGQQANV